MQIKRLGFLTIGKYEIHGLILCEKRPIINSFNSLCVTKLQTEPFYLWQVIKLQLMIN